MEKFGNACKGLGRLVNIIVPHKLDRKGRRFGFLFFREVQNPNAILEKLKQQQTSGFNILADFAKPKPKLPTQPSHHNHRQQNNLNHT